MPFAVRKRYTWRLRTRSVALGERTVLMGILNATPDSFSDGGEFLKVERAVEHALAMLEEGADILDLGGESTRPNATPVTAAEEQARVLPVLYAVLKARPDAIVSVDTYHAATARRALELGAEIVNDVSGLLWDPEMAGVLAQYRPGAVLMHSRGRPEEWAGLPALAPGEVLPLVLAGLRQSLALAQENGIDRASLVLDPGFGFGKRGDENLVLHAGLERLEELGCPVLAGTSRKRFLTANMLNFNVEDRLHATSASNVAAILAGTHLLRVHDVSAARAAASFADALLDAQEELSAL